MLFFLTLRSRRSGDAKIEAGSRQSARSLFFPQDGSEDSRWQLPAAASVSTCVASSLTMRFLAPSRLRVPEFPFFLPDFLIFELFTGVFGPSAVFYFLPTGLQASSMRETNSAPCLVFH